MSIYEHLIILFYFIMSFIRDYMLDNEESFVDVNTTCEIQIKDGKMQL